MGIAQEGSVQKGDKRLRDHDRDDFDQRIQEVRDERHGELLWYSKGSFPSFFRLSLVIFMKSPFSALRVIWQRYRQAHQGTCARMFFF